MVKVSIIGSRGRMGAALLGCVSRVEGLALAAQADQGDNLEEAVRAADIVVDFSTHKATLDVARVCAQHKKALVLGTTGHSEAEIQAVRAQIQTIPVVWASNFSTGVNTLFWLSRKAAQILGPDFDIEVIETHHRLKRDAPSGTAKSLANILAEARGLQLQQAARHGREGITGQRTSAEIGIHAVRGGDVVGDHTVLFATMGERVELTHKASSRETFAIGALRAARWLAGKPAGLYDMEDVLGLKSL